MKKSTKRILLATSLITLSILLHFIHYIVFKDLHHTMVYLVGDIAFVPLEIFLVSLVFENIIEKKNHEQQRKKTNMLIEIFYLELGNDLLDQFSDADSEITARLSTLEPNMAWDEDDFKSLANTIKSLNAQVDISKIDIPHTFELLTSSKSMLVNLISNPALTEEESFSDTLLSTFHLLDELKIRDLNNLTKDDTDHISVDLQRAYRGLMTDWVYYMNHLSKEYPYLYFSAITANPFTNTHNSKTTN